MDYITQEEKETLQAKLNGLVAHRPELVTRIAEARARGDLRENADYHAAREDQGMNERVIREIEEKLKSAQVADDSIVPEGMVFIGATVKLKDMDTDEEEVYRLVGEARVDLTAEHIEVSVNSPMGQSLMKARVGETIGVLLPGGRKAFQIIELL